VNDAKKFFMYTNCWCNKTEPVKENLKTVDVVVPEEDIKHLDEVSKINLGFPGDFLKRKV